ncbi:MAG: galactokinase [Balneolaceae bacterium]
MNRFGGAPLLVASPGRINLIGEHTDYNEGFVLPAAIDKSIWLAIAPNGLDKIQLYALDMNASYECNLREKLKKSPQRWPDYILGCIEQLQSAGKEIGGFDCLFGGDIPIGAGLSSSAALEGAVILGLSELYEWKLPKLERVRLAQKAENEFVGVQCGIMDQFANVYGELEQVIRLDCRTLNYLHVPFECNDTRVLLVDTNVRRELATSKYNVRRKQCEEGVSILKTCDSSIKSLRDVTRPMLEECRGEMSQIVYNRCRYVVEENQRVLAGCDDLEKGDLASFGQRMYESHYGLRDLYEVSCRELDILVEATEKMDDVLGARMMGGGFGGCTINLVPASGVERVSNELTAVYGEKTGETPDIHVVTIGAGTRIIPSNHKVPMSDE